MTHAESIEQRARNAHQRSQEAWLVFWALVQRRDPAANVWFHLSNAMHQTCLQAMRQRESEEPIVL